MVAVPSGLKVQCADSCCVTPERLLWHGPGSFYRGARGRFSEVLPGRALSWWGTIECLSEPLSPGQFQGGVPPLAQVVSAAPSMRRMSRPIKACVSLAAAVKPLVVTMTAKLHPWMCW